MNKIISEITNGMYFSIPCQDFKLFLKDGDSDTKKNEKALLFSSEKCVLYITLEGCGFQEWVIDVDKCVLYQTQLNHFNRCFDFITSIQQSKKFEVEFSCGETIYSGHVYLKYIQAIIEVTPPSNMPNSGLLSPFPPITPKLPKKETFYMLTVKGIDNINIDGYWDDGKKTPQSPRNC
jgi:hypothetical protein